MINEDYEDYDDLISEAGKKVRIVNGKKTVIADCDRSKGMMVDPDNKMKCIKMSADQKIAYKKQLIKQSKKKKKKLSASQIKHKEKVQALHDKAVGIKAESLARTIINKLNN